MLSYFRVLKRYNLERETRTTRRKQEKTSSSGLLWARNSTRIREQIGHPGSKRMFLTLQKFIAFKGMRKSIDTIVHRCLEYQMNKYSNICYRSFSRYIFLDFLLKESVPTFLGQ